MLNVLQSPWVQFPATLFLGVAIGVWLDVRLWKREQSAELRSLDRLDLAAEADELAQKISALGGDAAGRHIIAWEEDSNDFARGAGGQLGPTRNRSATERARLIERYGELYHQAAWSVITRAAKCIPLDRNATWRVRHLSSGEDILNVAALLTHIAIELRYPQPDIPSTETVRQIGQVAKPPPTPSN